MPKGYWIVRLDVTDPDVFTRYTAATPAVLGTYGARFLARGGAHESVEGTPRSRNGARRASGVSGASRHGLVSIS